MQIVMRSLAVLIARDLNSFLGIVVIFDAYLLTAGLQSRWN